MMRLAYALQLASLAILALFLGETTGATATAFSFIGAPLLLVSILGYGVKRLRERRGYGS